MKGRVMDSEGEGEELFFPGLGWNQLFPIQSKMPDLIEWK